MKDRFKFRIYSKRHNEIISSGPDLYGLNFGGQLLFNTMIGGYRVIEEERYLQDYVVMQCTGLKDKKDNLIYESDVILYEDNIKAEVIFQYGCWNTKIPLVTGEYLGLFNEFCEVIGNIYINPELLGEK